MCNGLPYFLPLKATAQLRDGVLRRRAESLFVVTAEVRWVFVCLLRKEFLQDSIIIGEDRLIAFLFGVHLITLKTKL